MVLVNDAHMTQLEYRMVVILAHVKEYWMKEQDAVQNVEVVSPVEQI